MILLEMAPILIYARAYRMLYNQYNKMEAQQHAGGASGSNLLEIKKRMRNKVRDKFTNIPIH